jgi:acyl dehydratase
MPPYADNWKGKAMYDNDGRASPTRIEAPILGMGSHWQDLTVGQRFRTLRRTVTETDLVNFISVTGMLEAVFIDATHEGDAHTRRPVPAALAHALIEGLLFQSLVQGTGLGVRALSLQTFRRVSVNDSIAGHVEIAEIPESDGERAAVVTVVDVVNQHDEVVLGYTARRLLKGRSNC